MKLISKFHDYYDSVLSSGRDDSIVYIRHTEEIKQNKKATDEIKELFDDIPSKHLYLNNGCFSPVLICFCGKIYLAYKFHMLQENPIKEINLMLYSIEDVENVIKKYKMAGWGLTEEYRKRIRTTKSIPFYYRRTFIKENVEKAFKKYSGKTSTNLNLTYKTPVIAIHYDDNYKEIQVISNPVLRKYDFVRVFDPYTAFQEISMYIGGVITNKELPMPEFSEKIKVAQHGFDKWSFRRMPGDKKGKKK